MAKLSFQEKQLIERVFGMGSGYVLNFSNREFEEFMKDVVSYNIYQKYPGLSKAKMLRRFIEDESDAYVGKMIILLINYMKSNSLDKNITQEEFKTNYGKFKLLNSKVKLLWGDGIDYHGMRSILFAMFNNMYSAANLACFGQGGGLLQKVDRDTQRICFKSSSQFYDGAWHDVYKSPKDISKTSKRGRLALIKENDKFKTIRLEELNNCKNYLETVFENGKMVKEYTFEEVRNNAKI